MEGHVIGAIIWNYHVCIYIYVYKGRANCHQTSTKLASGWAAIEKFHMEVLF